MVAKSGPKCLAKLYLALFINTLMECIYRRTKINERKLGKHIAILLTLGQLYPLAPNSRLPMRTILLPAPIANS